MIVAMSRALTAFAFVAVLSGLLMALSLAVARHGYPFGAIGARRLNEIANAATFLPLAAIYFASALLIMILPIRAAGAVLLNASEIIFWTVIALFATIVGSLLARLAFGQSGALWALWNWRFLFVAAVVGCHVAMDSFRRNILLRSLFFVIFAAATLACLFWSFTL
jgi:hypothetical protein